MHLVGRLVRLRCISPSAVRMSRITQISMRMRLIQQTDGRSRCCQMLKGIYVLIILATKPLGSLPSRITKPSSLKFRKKRAPMKRGNRSTITTIKSRECSRSYVGDTRTKPLWPKIDPCITTTPVVSGTPDRPRKQAQSNGSRNVCGTRPGVNSLGRLLEPEPFLEL